jgi:hypothetical protein
LRLAAGFLALGLASLSDDDVPEELLAFFFSSFFFGARFGFDFIDLRPSSFFSFSFDDDELLPLLLDFLGFGCALLRGASAGFDGAADFFFSTLEFELLPEDELPLLLSDDAIY